MNGDGKLDLLIGDSVTLVSPTKGVSKEEFKKKFAAWKKAFEVASKELSAARGDDKEQAKVVEAYNKIYQERREFMIEDRTGFVWLYLRK